MLENMNDIISLFVLVISVVIGFWGLFVVFDRHHAEKMKRREEQYMFLLEEMEDEDSDTDTFEEIQGE